MQHIKRFTAIEGLRGWLAWGVVVTHLSYFADYGFLKGQMDSFGSDAVIVFIVVSGFVITHLILNHPEPYKIYILRRFMRIFPLFVVTCIGGYFTYKLTIEQLQYGFADQGFAKLLTKVALETDLHLWQNMIVHTTMLHGLFNHVLPSSYMAFNMPAWSLSLEWQFYLVAPFVIFLVQRRPLLIALIACLGLMAFKKGLLLDREPAMLPAMAQNFAVGIACRFFYPMLAGKKLDNISAALATAAIAYMLFGKTMTLWLIVYSGLTFQISNKSVVSFYYQVFESKVAIYFGSRSYSTYLCHLPLMMMIRGLWVWEFSIPPSALALTIMTVPAVIILSEILYSYIEIPGIKLGSIWCNRISKRM